MNQKINLIDCTLRDGGYYTNWDYDDNFINEYIAAIKTTPITHIELGYKFLRNKGFKGIYAFCPQEIIDKFLVANKSIGIMINASEVIDLTYNQLKNSLNLQSLHDLSFIRIALKADQLENIKTLSIYLNDIGISFAVNIMQASSLKEKDLIKIEKTASKLNPMALYFADSFGSLRLESTKILIETFKNIFDGPIGIHCHDNLKLANANTITAISSGCTWFDATVMGMGRGAGNAVLEELLMEPSIHNLLKVDDNSFDLNKLYSFIEEYMSPLKKKYNWGTNLLYYKSGILQIHPSYSSFLIDDDSYSFSDKVNIISRLSNVDKSTFAKTKLNLSYLFNVSSDLLPNGSADPLDLIQNKNILVVANGPSCKQHKEAIELFTEKKNIFTISLNQNKFINPNCIDAIVMSNPLKILNLLKDLKYPYPKLITSKALIKASEIQLPDTLELVDYGINLKENVFNAYKNYCNINSLYAFEYFLAIAGRVNPDKVYLAGFDGYQDIDKHNFNQNLIEKCTNNFSTIKFISVTNTKYNILKSSIYGEIYSSRISEDI